MYEIRDAKRGVRKVFTEELIGRGDITVDAAQQQLREYQAELERVFKASRDAAVGAAPHGGAPGARSPTRRSRPRSMPRWYARSGRPTSSCRRASPRTSGSQQVLERRAKMGVEGDIDWGFGEIIAFGSLLAQGVTVRLSGQDSRRGTFVQRHAAIVDAETGEDFLPLSAWPPTTPGSSSTTRCCPSTPRWASSTATRWRTPRRW